MEIPAVEFPIFMLIRLIGFTVTVLLFAWTFYFRGGIAIISDNKPLVFNNHPLLTVVSLVLLNGEAMLAYKTLSGTKSFKKLIHLSLQSLNLCLAVIGVWAVLKLHLDKGSDNFYSLHSWLGLASLLLFSIQWGAGFTTFWYPGGSKSSRTSLLPWHVFFGVYIYALSIASTVTGILERATSLQRKNLITRYSTEAMLLNTMGVLIALLGGLVVLALVAQNYIV